MCKNNSKHVGQSSHTITLEHHHGRPSTCTRIHMLDIHMKHQPQISLQKLKAHIQITTNRFICHHLDCLFQLIIDPEEEEAPVFTEGIYV